MATVTVPIDPDAWKAVVEHAESAYPDECCGVLLGRWGDEVRIEAALKTTNVSADRRTCYEIDPRDILRAEVQARGRGLSVIGSYHSHPNGSLEFSETDAALACPWYVYVVVSLIGGQVAGVRAYRFSESGGGDDVCIDLSLESGVGTFNGG